MKTLIILLVSFLLYSCENIVNKKNEERMDELTGQAELSQAKIYELPLGFHFGMTKEEADKNIADLISKNLIRSTEDGFEYTYKTIKDITYKLQIEFQYHDESLYILRFESRNLNDNDVNLLNEDISSKLSSEYTKVQYEEQIIKNEKFSYCKWIKDNQIIFLSKIGRVAVEYINAPVDKIISNANTKKMMQESFDRLDKVKIENSSWDGSVYQVEKHLKKNLKDPDSYEGIEWSEVQETSDGYTVRHKYRAKNSFGGYVIENQIFHIDKSGDVITATSAE